MPDSGADEITAKFDGMRRELARIKRRQLRLRLILARIKFYRIAFSFIAVPVRLGFKTYDHIKKFIGNS